MHCRSIRLLLIIACLVAFPFRSPAPLIYRPGEGWTYEPVGGEGKWHRARAKDQLDLAKEAFEKKDYGLALKSARRVVRVWPLSDYAPEAQYLVGRCYEAKGNDYRAFKEYQKLVEKNPKGADYDEIAQRQFTIANRYLAGKWFKLWGFIPFFPSMDKTAQMYEKIVKNGPYSEVAPQAQLNVGKAREKQSDYPAAVKAYETAADRYHDRPKVSAEALYRQGLAYNEQAKTAEYDQNSAGLAIATFTDFLVLFPDDPRATEAENIIKSLKAEQSRGNFRVAEFYEKRHRWKGALIYYNESVYLDPTSPHASIANERIDRLKRRMEPVAPELAPDVPTAPATAPAAQPTAAPSVQ
jgi:outer membrane protein assembly factor BamD